MRCQSRNERLVPLAHDASIRQYDLESLSIWTRLQSASDRSRVLAGLSQRLNPYGTRAFLDSDQVVGWNGTDPFDGAVRPAHL